MSSPARATGSFGSSNVASLRPTTTRRSSRSSQGDARPQRNRRDRGPRRQGDGPDAAGNVAAKWTVGRSWLLEPCSCAGWSGWRVANSAGPCSRNWAGVSVLRAGLFVAISTNRDTRLAPHVTHHQRTNLAEVSTQTRHEPDSCRGFDDNADRHVVVRETGQECSRTSIVERSRFLHVVMWLMRRGSSHGNTCGGVGV
jgi:hypothetical protein